MQGGMTAPTAWRLIVLLMNYSVRNNKNLS
jgi:hypothetical protein